MGYDTGTVNFIKTYGIDVDNCCHVEASSGMVIVHLGKGELCSLFLTPADAFDLAECLKHAAQVYTGAE